LAAEGVIVAAWPTLAARNIPKTNLTFTSQSDCASESAFDTILRSAFGPRFRLTVYAVDLAQVKLGHP
jgi:hypothetical protein